MSDQLPEFPFDASPRADRCDKCAAGEEHDLRFVIVRGRTRYVGRTLCDTCAEEVLETMIAADSETDLIA
jgi:superfamily II helicase